MANTQAAIEMDDAEKEKLAASQEVKMRRFFDSLNGRQRRVLRHAADKVAGRKESLFDMMVRLTKTSDELSPLPPPATPTTDEQADDGR